MEYNMEYNMEQWKADRLMKRAKKKARKSLEKEGYHPKTAAKLVNQALKRISNEVENNDA